MATLSRPSPTTPPSGVGQSPLARHAGPLSLAAGVLLIIQQLVMVSFLDHSHLEATMAHPLYVPTAVAYPIAFSLLLIALVAVYEWEADRAGILGAVGFGAAAVGTMFLAGDAWFEAFAVPWIGHVAPQALKLPAGMLVGGAFASYVLFAAGWAIFGLASLRARAFPVVISIAIVVVGVVGFGALVPPYAVPLGLALVWLGVWMMRTPATNRKAAFEAA